MGVEALGYFSFYAVEGSAAYKEYVLRVNRNHTLFGMLAASLWGHVDNRAFKEFEQTLLHSLAGDVAGNRGIVPLAGYFVDFVDEDYSALRFFDIVVGYLEQARQQALDILAYISGLGKHRRVDDCERNVEHFGDSLGKKCLARSRGADEHDVALFDIDVVVFSAGLLKPFVMVVDRYGKVAFGAFLPDHVLVEERADFFGLRDSLHFLAVVRSGALGTFSRGDVSPELCQEFVDGVGTFGAKEHALVNSRRDQDVGVVGGSAAKRAALLLIFLFCHLFLWKLVEMRYGQQPGRLLT